MLSSISGMSSTTTQHDPENITDIPKSGGLSPDQHQDRKEDHAGERKVSASTACSDNVLDEATSSTASEHGSSYSATSASDGNDSDSGSTDTASETSDESEDEVASLPEGHGVLCGWGQSHSFGGDFSFVPRYPRDIYGREIIP